MKELDSVRTLITEYCVHNDIQPANIAFLRTSDLVHGDVTTNFAMVMAKQLGKNPIEFAKDIVRSIEEKVPDSIRKIEIAGPGFINIYFSNQMLVHNILEQTLISDYTNHLGKHILVEHSSPNLFKPFHIGHVMNNTIGESIVRLAKASGAKVTTISYPSDISLGIAKAIRTVLRDGIEKLRSLQTEKEQIAYLGQCYVTGTAEFAESKEIEAECRVIAQKLYDAIDGIEYATYLECRKINISYFESIITKLGSHFDAYIYESEAGVEGQSIVMAHIGDIFKQSEGAVVFEGEEYGLHTRVFINSEGYPTYEAKDIGLMSLKDTLYNPDISILVTDNEQSQYYKVVKKAAGLIKPKWDVSTIHRTHGRMSFQGAKMSSRLGNTPLAEDLLSEVISTVTERNPDLSERDAFVVGLCALKFVILRAKAGNNINFDPETSLSLEGDSGPYLQYTVVRIKSLLEKAQYQDSVRPNSIPEKCDLERVLIHYNSVVKLAIEEWAPHYIVTYLLELAQAYNSWYGNTRIIDDNNPLMQYNVSLSKKVADVITHGLSLLTIEIPEKM